MQHVAVLQDLGHAPRRFARRVHFHYCLVLGRIEWSIERIDPLHSESPEEFCEQLVGRYYPADPAICGGLIRSGGARLNGPMEIVDNLQQFAGEVRYCISLGVIRASLALSARIFGLRKG